jgi:AcrR family transcriptional regulator
MENPSEKINKRPGKPDGARAQNRRARTEALSEAALELFLEIGIEAVTIDQIVGSADMAKGTFYRYFNDKEAIVQHLLAPVSREAEKALGECQDSIRKAQDRAGLLSSYQDLAQNLVTSIYANADVARLFLQESRGPDRGAVRPVAQLSRLILEHSIALTVAAQSHGLQRDIEPEVSARAVVGAVESLILASLDGSLQVSAPKVWTGLISLVVDGLKVEQANG